ncbi:hypothetical protein ES705_37904 [subsurface metagenome]
MKRFLKKRWLGLPIGIITVVLLVFLLVGGTLAATGAFRVFTSETEVTVLEPLEVTEIQATGEFWDWGDPELDIQHPLIYAGMDLGATGVGGKYFILNLMPSENPRGTPIPTQFISVTVTVEETTGQMEWYGIDIYPSNGWGGEDTCNYNLAFVKSTAESNVQTFTFDMGSVTYPTPLDDAADIGIDSNQVKFFVQGKIADNAGLVEPLNFIVTVDRG